MFKYNPNDTVLTIDGVYLTGMGDGDVTFAFQEERFTAVVGNQGDVVMNETNNKLADLAFELQPSSPQYKMCLDYARKGTVFPVWGVNKSIGERFGGTKARFKNPAEVTYGAELGNRSFEILVVDGTHEPA